MNICPICGQETEGTYCPVCGWEHRQYPALMPEAVRQLEEERLAAARKVFEDNRRAQETLKSHLAEAKQLLDNANKEVRDLTNKLEEAKSEVSYAYLVQSYNGVLQNVYPICEGDNTFGSVVSCEPGYRQVLEGTLSSRNFTIRTALQVNPRGKKRASYSIIPLEGNVAVASAANVIRAAQPLPLLEKIFVGELVFQLLDDIDT